jgi:hypothetical protein
MIHQIKLRAAQHGAWKSWQLVVPAPAVLHHIRTSAGCPNYNYLRSTSESSAQVATMVISYNNSTPSLQEALIRNTAMDILDSSISRSLETIAISEGVRWESLLRMSKTWSKTWSSERVRQALPGPRNILARRDSLLRMAGKPCRGCMGNEAPSINCPNQVL